MALSSEQQFKLLKVLEDEPKEQQVTEEWENELQKTERGKNKSNAYNVLLILRNDIKLKDKFAYNTFSHKLEVIGDVPWKRVSTTDEWTDFDDANLRNYISINYDIKAKDIIEDALKQVVMENQYNPVQQYLKNAYANWDSGDRIDTLLIDYFGAEDTELIRMQTRLALVGAVKRIFEPGCKMDYVLTLKGGQGIGKSTFAKDLAVNENWFSDSLKEVESKDAKEHLLGNWIVELGEMSAVRKKEQEATKQFITSTHDKFRHAYGKRTVSYPRQCIFIATTNDEQPLRDRTGNRRWWIVEVHENYTKKREKMPLDVNQIWGEAVHTYYSMKAKNEPITLPNYLESEAKKIQLENTDRGVFADEIEYILNDVKQVEHNGITKAINVTCAKDVWVRVLKRHEFEFTSARAREINSILQNLKGWEKSKSRIKFGTYGKQWVYSRTNN